MTLYRANILLFMCVCISAEAHQFMLPPSSEERAALVAINEDTPTSVLFDHLESNSYYVSVRAAQDLAKRPSDEVTQELSELAENPSREDSRFTQFAVFLALSLCKDGPQLSRFIRAPEVVELFEKERYLTDTDRQHIRRIQAAFCRYLTYGKPAGQHSSILISQLTTRPDWVSDSLVQMGDLAMEPLLAIAGDPSVKESVRSAVVDILSKSKDPRVAPVLKKLVESEGVSGRLVGQTVSALIRLDVELGLEYAMTFERKAGPIARLNLLRVLADAPDRRVLQWLTSNLKGSQPFEHQTDTAEWRRRIQIQKGTTIAAIEVDLAADRTGELIEKLQRELPIAVRRFAAESLKGNRDERVFPRMEHLLDDSDPELRSLAIQIIGEHPSPDVVSLLETVLKKGDFRDRVTAYDLLRARGIAVFRIRDGYEVARINEELLGPFRILAKPPKFGRSHSLSKGCEFGETIAAGLKSSSPAIRNASETALSWVFLASVNPADELAAFEVLSCVYDRGPALLVGLIGSHPNDSKLLKLLPRHGKEAARALAACIERRSSPRTQPDFRERIEVMLDVLLECGPEGEFSLQYFSESDVPWLKAEATERIKKLEAREK